jgi:hypothetical protein
VLQNALRDQTRGILGQNQSGNPLAALGASLFGEHPAPTQQQPAQSGEQSSSQQPTQQQQEPTNPLADLFRQATRPRTSSSTTTSTTAPSP